MINFESITISNAQPAVIEADTSVRVVAEPERITIETQPKRVSLVEMLANFDLQRHGGEAMAFLPVGKESMQ